MTQLSGLAQLTLRCYDTAAVLLQQSYWTELQSLLGTMNRLPDQFSDELGLRRWSTPSEQLQALAHRHAFLSESHINWLGIYKHAAQRFITSMVSSQSSGVIMPTTADKAIKTTTDGAYYTDFLLYPL